MPRDDTTSSDPDVGLISAEYNTTAAQTDDDMLGAIGTGERVALVAIEAVLDKATTVGVGVRIGFGAATVPAAGASGAAATAGVALSHPGIVAGGGVAKAYPDGKPLKGAAGEELRITNDVPTGGKLVVVVTYFMSPD